MFSSVVAVVTVAVPEIPVTVGRVVVTMPGNLKTKNKTHCHQCRFLLHLYTRKLWPYDNLLMQRIQDVFFPQQCWSLAKNVQFWLLSLFYTAVDLISRWLLIWFLRPHLPNSSKSSSQCRSRFQVLQVLSWPQNKTWHHFLCFTCTTRPLQSYKFVWYNGGKKNNALAHMSTHLDWGLCGSGWYWYCCTWYGYWSGLAGGLERWVLCLSLSLGFNGGWLGSLSGCCCCWLYQ